MLEDYEEGVWIPMTEEVKDFSAGFKLPETPPVEEVKLPSFTTENDKASEALDARAAELDKLLNQPDAEVDIISNGTLAGALKQELDRPVQENKLGVFNKLMDKSEKLARIEAILKSSTSADSMQIKKAIGQISEFI